MVDLRDGKCSLVPEYVDSYSQAYIPLPQKSCSLYTRQSYTASHPLLCSQGHCNLCAWLSLAGWRLLKAHTMIFLNTPPLKSSKASCVCTLCLCLIYEKFTVNALNPTPFYFIFRCLLVAWYLLTLDWSSRALWSTLPAPDFFNT